MKEVLIFYADCSRNLGLFEVEQDCEVFHIL
jgi:hypothetical protein